MTAAEIESLPIYRFFRDTKAVFENTASVADVAADAVIENPDSGDSFTERTANIRFMARRIGERRETRGVILWALQEQTEFDVQPLELARRVFAWLRRPDTQVRDGEQLGKMPLAAFTGDGTYLRALGNEVPW